MDWVVFTYSLPTKLRSSPRVALWRRLKRLGAVSLAGGMQVLPAQDECVEAFQWLAQEIRQAQGEALVMRVEKFEGLTDQQVINLFNRSRQEEYHEIEAQLEKLEKMLVVKNKKVRETSEAQAMLDKLRKRHAEVARVDYFDCPEGSRVSARFIEIEQALSPKSTPSTKIESALLAEYRDKRWMTRPRPHVDRLACVWLIRRFIDPNAVIRYAMQPEPDEIAFDIEDGHFGHQGNLCTFEIMQRTFNLKDSVLMKMAEIVHEIDLLDGRYSHSEIDGIDGVLKGWLSAGFSDAELESHGVALFEGLYATLSSHSASARQKEKTKKQK
ncbi:chromate resistance protein [Candidatus Acetothermia bacterium]|nr:chromate resistance protein [Candidatus Acetothermia bacterium]